MSTIFLDSALPDESRRLRLYEGALFAFSPRPATRALCDHARAMLEEAFAPHDPRTVHEALPVEACVEVLARLKPAFIHHPRSKALIRDLLEDLGCDLERVYFDVPRLRSAYPVDYLTSGIAYAFHPHRDTWYSAPLCQVNWWLPLYEIVPDNCMAFHPRYFGTPVRNSSETYNYYRWNAESRGSAAAHVKEDTRPQPKPLEEIDRETQARILCRPGGMMLFSAAQLHETVPNTSGVARYSVDFRTVHRDDVERRRGAGNVDSRCTGTSLRDFLRGADLARLPEDLVRLYDDGTEVGGVLVFAPASRP